MPFIRPSIAYRLLFPLFLLLSSFLLLFFLASTQSATRLLSEIDFVLHNALPKPSENKFQNVPGHRTAGLNPQLILLASKQIPESGLHTLCARLENQTILLIGPP